VDRFPFNRFADQQFWSFTTNSRLSESQLQVSNSRVSWESSTEGTMPQAPHARLSLRKFWMKRMRETTSNIARKLVDHSHKAEDRGILADSDI
jgi:hypothetical protein